MFSRKFVPQFFPKFIKHMLMEYIAPPLSVALLLQNKTEQFPLNERSDWLDKNKAPPFLTAVLLMKETFV